ncbi:MAG TPA: PSD1 and planctomycete cytochrome C domain-containing protein [Pirellulales bacterium]|jgi:mono/diheme cytochrome c family protein
MRRSLLLLLLVVAYRGGAIALGDEKVAPGALPPAAEQPVDFARDVRPIFARSCVSCHGPEKAESDLRLDNRAGATAGGASGPAWTAGKSAESLLVQYIAGTSESGTVMPPEGQRLSPRQIGLVRAWIDQGAKWPDDGGDKQGSSHWSFQPMRKELPPAVKRSVWVRNGVDAFVLARLEAEGIDPSPEADRATLIRRLSLDLLGLPPAPGEVEDFVRDNRHDAYEQLVDRLLASPHYGERWGRHWLDLARYADSDGYEKDTPRPFAWRYRNWVIDALNSDLPFDQFTIQQLAGDLLPDTDTDARVATGFHRNTLLNKEGGADQEEFRVAATIDRVNTTGSVWLGLTVACAQCHTHKYDPIQQREYYGLFAFFNSLKDEDIPAPLAEELSTYQTARAAYDAEHARLQAEATRYEQESFPVRQAEWEKSVDPRSIVGWTDARIITAKSAGGATLEIRPDGSLFASGTNPEVDTYTIVIEGELAGATALRLEPLADPALSSKGPGRTGHGNFVLNEFRVALVSPDADPMVGESGKPVALDKAIADFTQKPFSPQATIDGDVKTGWAIEGALGRDHQLIVSFKVPLDAPAGTKLLITLDQQHGGAHTIGRLRLSTTTAKQPLVLNGLSARHLAELQKPAAERSAEARAALDEYYRSTDAELRKLRQAVEKHAKSAPADPNTTTKAQAFVELPKPRETHVLIKGDFLRPGATVEAHTLSVLPSLAARGERPDRLDLARWLVDPENPLMARVTVNRVWQRYFGRGLVASSNDFGTQGDKPTHPELLDWLAREFIRQGWSQKQLHRLIVTSATYRQSSAARPELAERDAYNTLLARQNRQRVEAEVVRDVALCASGLLNRAIGGPSVRPVQPEGVADLGYSGSVKWPTSKGADRYRRGMYTFFQRTVPYPMLMTFDAPDSNTTCTRRERSNTPLQALTLLNDPAFVECAQSLARRILSETPAPDVNQIDLPGRIRHAFLLCLSREPTSVEREALLRLYERQRALCEATPEAAAKLVGQPQSKSDEKRSPAETTDLAVWVVIARTLLNTDEFITRE